VRVYLPPDANCLLSVFDHCLRSRHYVNVVVAGKHALPQWLTMTRQWCIARKALASGMGQQRPGRRAGRGDGVLRRHAHAGDPGCRFHPSRALPDLKIRVINVVDLMKCSPVASTRTG